MAKKRTGAYSTSNVSGYDFLPTPFKTDINKKWLDATFDQMISKGALDPYDGFIGSIHGKYRKLSDTYVDIPKHTKTRELVQFMPGILSKANNKYENLITFDDIANSINTRFDTYNYNSAYATQPYVYNPPIDIDKFVNYTNYYWVQDIPVYVAINQTSTFDILQDIENESTYTLTDDNNTFSLHNGMIIEFDGMWGNASNNTYLVTGIGEKVHFVELKRDGKIVWTNAYKYNSKNDGYWDNTKITNVEPNVNSKYWTQTYNNQYPTPIEMLDAFENDTSATKPVLFDGFNLDNYESNTTYFTESIYAKFSSGWGQNWTTADKNKVYFVEFVKKDTVNISLVVDAVVGPQNEIQTTILDAQLARQLGTKFDEIDWDTSPIVLTDHDYFVIDRADAKQTAWSRSNAWVHVSCLETLQDLIDFDIKKYINQTNRASRPIIEFNTDMFMYNGAEFVNNTWHGTIDAAIDTTDLVAVESGTDIMLTLPEVAIGANVIFVDNFKSHIYTKTDSVTFEQLVAVNDFDSLFVMKSVGNLSANYEHADVYFANGDWHIAQEKTKVNQAPLFNLYDTSGNSIDDFDNSFSGNKVFGYKKGTGHVDPVLDMQLSYKDTANGAEYEFENCILTTKHDYNITDSIDTKLSWKQNINGYYYFKRNNKLQTVYVSSDVSTNTFENMQFEITNSLENLIIDLPSDGLYAREEFVLHSIGNDYQLYQTSYTGINLRKYTSIVTENNSDVKIHNLLNGVQLLFIDDGVNVEDSSYTGNLTVTRSSTEVVLHTNNFVGQGLNPVGHKIKAVLDSDITETIFDIFVEDTIASKYHRLYLNGKPINKSDYTISNNTISINNNIFEPNDIIDLEFVNQNLTNKTTNVSVPHTMKSNATNEVMYDFTISETMDHWTDMMVAMPGFEGDVFDKNNYNQINKFTTYGGTIFLNEDISIMHDAAYANNNMSITGALVEQGTDYDVFKVRFRNQVRRLYASQHFSTVKDITKKALETLANNKRGSSLYKNSNMVFGHKGFTELVTLQSQQTTYKFKHHANGDSNIRDHVYVWLESDFDNNDTYYRKILLKDVDYTVTGNVVELLFTPNIPSSGQLPKLEIQFHSMDEESYVPQSMVKLGLSYPTQPQVVDQKLYTHDGSYYDLADSATIFDMQSPAFDVVNAAQYELECMIYAGLVKPDTLYDESVNNNYVTDSEFLPSQHLHTWYEISKIDNYIERQYVNWATTNNKQRFLAEYIYDQNDPKTWNYSELTADILGAYQDHLKNESLPGYYKGIYKVLFGTYTPNLTPWHMLGHAFKPDWWDTAYAFGDTTRFNNLKTALRTGLTSNPALSAKVQDPKFARYAWDWDNKCPFDEDGILISPELVFGTPIPEHARQPFDFKDHGPTSIEFRQSNVGIASTIDALCKLLPATGFTKLFQPGHTTSFSNKDLVLSTVDNKLINPATFKIPGEIYGNTITNIKIVSPDVYDVNTSYANMYGSDINEKVKLVLNFTDMSASTSPIESICFNKRLDNIQNEAVFYSNTIGQKDNDNIELEYTYAKVAHVANGVSQAQYNYNLRNNLDIDLVEFYKTLNTALMQKAAGFTKKDKVSFVSESSSSGAFSIESSDYDVAMYQGAPYKNVNASIVKIIRKAEGYQLNGVSSLDQRFNFLEPVLQGNNAFTNITVKGSSIKKYNNFHTTPSSIMFGTVFSKIQDVYNFIRGYYKFLELAGYSFETSADGQASLFASWAIGSEVDDTIVLDFGTTIEFTSEHGHIYKFNTLNYPVNNLLDINGNIINQENIIVDRTGANLKIKSDIVIGSVLTSVLDYEHIFVFKDKTIFGNTLFDKSKNQKIERLIARGQVTTGWTGNKTAPGYLVFDDHIVQNFDSSVQEVDDFYKNDVTEFNSNITKAKNISIGNIERDWLAELNLDPNVIAKFYQGAIKEQGTSVSIDRLARFIKGAKDITVNEEFMFNHSYFGDTTRKESIEIQLRQKDILSNPQVIEFSETSTNGNNITIVENDKKIVNNGIKQFAITQFDDSPVKLLTAGEPLSTEATYTANTTSDLKNVWDSSAEYAKIEKWVDNKSYVRGDLVRRNGSLYKCNVNETGLLSVNEGIEEVGTNTNPIFPYGTIVELDTETITLQETTTAFDDIVATGTIQNPVVNDLDVLEIGQTQIVFRGTSQSSVVLGSADIVGSIITPNFTSVRNKSITINNTFINFDNIPQNVLENTVFVGEIAATPGDPTAIPPVPATPLVPAVTSYTINQTLSNNGYFVDDVLVNGISQVGNYTVSGQTLTFIDVSGFASGDSIRIELEHVDSGMSTSQILSTINNAGVSGLVASLTSQGTLQLSYTSSSTSAQLVLSSGATNGLLGLPTSGATQNVVVGLAYDALTVDEIVNQINNFNTLPLDIRATNNNNALEIRKQNASADLTFGTNRNAFGLNDRYAYSTSTVNTSSNALSAVNAINNYFTNLGTTDIVASIDNSRIKIESTRQSLNIGSTAFNTIAGLETGIRTNLQSNVANTFNSSEWTLVDDIDPTLFNVWVVNDSDYAVERVDNIVSKFNSWNMLNVQNHNLFTQDTDDEDGCGICAGTATSDGNDAQVTTNRAHNLSVGDYVLLTNTDTVPKIDGIHKVTSVHPSDNTIFYIDMYIERCGNASAVYVLRNQRFENRDQLDLAELSSSYQINEQSLSYCNFNSLNQRSTNVFVKQNGAFETNRKTNYRVRNTDIENITIYDYSKNTIVSQLELFDPLRGIIPGVAQRDLDVTSNIDTAAYNYTNDETYDVVDSAYWGDEQVGKRWWNTSTVRYYDYDQGDFEYQSSHWGKIFPGSTIDVYEWTKSTVSPELYNNAVDTNKVMYGNVATGSAYSVYDSELQEDIYYYCESVEWNDELKVEETVYYFWVKDKTTKPANKFMTVKELADVLYDPSATGIAWFAALTPSSLQEQTHSNAIIVSNSDLYLNDTSTVMQINMVPDNVNHNSWQVITRDVDLIPEYFYIGMRNNLATVDAYDTTLPNYYIHEFNRYGDDRSIAQTWFIDRVSAREDARVTINRLLKEINMFENLKNTWDRLFVQNEMPSKTWKWTNYVNSYRNVFNTPTITVDKTSDLVLIDTSLHQTAMIEILEDNGTIDRSEIFEYINQEWILTEKRNSTIELLPIVARNRAGWDNFGWDTTTWDNTDTVNWWRTIIDSCRHLWFIDNNVDKFNKLFFSLVEYVMSEQPQTNWIHKSTYVRLDISHDIDTVSRKYKNDTVDSIIGYVNTVKPFHTKVRTIKDTRFTNEEFTVSISDSVKQNITLEYNDYIDQFNGTVYDAGNDWNDYTDTIENGDNWDDYADTFDNGAFHQPNMSVSNMLPVRQHNLDVLFGTTVEFKVQTNIAGDTVDADSRTFAYVQRINEQPVLVGLEASKSTTLTQDIAHDAASVEASDLSMFNESGIAYINGEIVKYHKVGNTLYLNSRATYGTYNKAHYTGDIVIDITDSFLTSSKQGTIMLNDIGQSILGSTDSTSASELQVQTQGIEL